MKIRLRKFFLRSQAQHEYEASADRSWYSESLQYTVLFLVLFQPFGLVSLFFSPDGSSDVELWMFVQLHWSRGCSDAEVKSDFKHRFKHGCAQCSLGMARDPKSHVSTASTRYLPRSECPLGEEGQCVFCARLWLCCSIRLVNKPPADFSWCLVSYFFHSACGVAFAGGDRTVGSCVPFSLCWELLGPKEINLWALEDWRSYCEIAAAAPWDKDLGTLFGTLLATCLLSSGLMATPD